MEVRDIQVKYTIDNPKLVESFHNPGEDNFTGVVRDKYGNIAYFQNGSIHREDGPAVISFSGNKQWLIHNKFHREDGPAFELSDGSKVWYYNGERYGWNDDFTVESWIKNCKLEIFK